MIWKSKTINLGEIPIGKKQTAIFQALEPLEISTLTSSCGCTTPTYDVEKNQVSVFYTPGNIPIHLRHLRVQPVTKTVTVHYKDGSSEV